MSHTIKTMYVVHHSHTDIGYTDLQERVIQCQINYIRSVLQLMKQPENQDFRWNCETWFCVEQFLKTATPEEQEEFFQLLREGRIGLSASYLNFTDLADSQVLSRRMDQMCQVLGEHHIRPTTAMFADINGISMGQRDDLINHRVDSCIPTSTAMMACIPFTKTGPPIGGKTPRANGCWCGTENITIWATPWESVSQSRIQLHDRRVLRGSVRTGRSGGHPSPQCGRVSHPVRGKWIPL